MGNDEFNPEEVLKDFADKAEEKAQEVSADIEQKAEEAKEAFEEKTEAAEEAAEDMIEKAEDFAEEAKEAAEEKAEALEEAAEDMVEKAEDFAEEAEEAAEEKAEAAEEAVEDMIDDAEDSVTVTLETLMADEPEDEEDRLESPVSSRKPSIPQYVPKTYAREEKVSETCEFSDEPEVDVLEPVGGRVAGVRATVNAKGDKSSKTAIWIILAVLVCLCVGACCMIQAFLAILRLIARTM